MRVTICLSLFRLLQQGSIDLVVYTSPKSRSCSSRVWESKISKWLIWCLTGAHFLVCVMVKVVRDLSEASFTRTLISFMMAQASWHNHLPKISSPNTVRAESQHPHLKWEHSTLLPLQIFIKHWSLEAELGGGPILYRTYRLVGENMYETTTM